ncbi:uncharacterized protein LOC111442979 isoform X2 [Cucurbita moschata]|uniref:Uncharacterized protein LOC111442979 isoform X2 n=1 Tax=Cucurbita moschata TaxID=3662 RepID=A0A6J1F850_CUCMO|nr:uncharacterized protein LOC111442979 isoform X2 [Cucurbita moschata]
MALSSELFLKSLAASGLLDEDVSHAQLVNLSLPWIIAMARFCKYSHGAISPRRFLRPATEAVPYFEQGMCGRSCLMLLELLFQTEINRPLHLFLWLCGAAPMDYCKTWLLFQSEEPCKSMTSAIAP